MKIIVTKQTIINVLGNEPIQRLRPGTFLGPMMGVEDNAVPAPVSMDVCPRCAVGAMLCAVLAPNDNFEVMDKMVDEIAATGVRGCEIAPFISMSDKDIRDDIVFNGAKELLERGQVMAALSYYFEGRCSVRDLEAEEEGEIEEDEDITDDVVLRARVDTINFVQDHFPDSMLIDINGYEPAKDVLVVGAVGDEEEA